MVEKNSDMEESTFSNGFIRSPGNSFNGSGNLLAFGVLAVEQGLIGWPEVNGALDEQQRRRSAGRGTRIGEILLEQGLLSGEEVTRIFEFQGTLGGHTEIDGYEIIKEIGKGAMGRIFMARQTSMDRIVALKIITPKLAMDKKFIQRFLRESRLAGKLRHHNIVFVDRCRRIQRRPLLRHGIRQGKDPQGNPRQEEKDERD
jgi:hypothetical protein